MKTSAPCCATYASTAIVKAGHNDSGTQQYLCKACGAHRVLQAKNTATDPERKSMILRAVEVERLSLRAARARVRHGAADHRQVARKKTACLPPLSETLLPAEQGDVLELDELWSFVGSKLNARWLWIALCRQTRQVVAYFVGDRSAESARALRERIPPKLPLPSRPQRLLAGLRRGFPPAHPPSVRQGGGRDLPCRALEQHASPTTRPLCPQDSLLFQV